MIELVIDCDDWITALPDYESLAVKCLAHVREAGVPCDGAVAVMLANDIKVAELNAQFRGKQGATNVLSFPGAGDDHLGDIAIALETCHKEAAEKKIAFDDHVAHLIVHGLLHLAGYDHVDDRDAEIMEALESKILSTMGIVDPYLDCGLPGETS